MALNSELLITLQQVKGIGNKTILDVANTISCNTIEELCESIDSIKKGRLAEITAADIYDAYCKAKKIIAASEDNGIGILSYYDSAFPSVLQKCTDEKGNLNPPIVLYYRGTLDALKKPGVAVIGTREPTLTGEKAGLYFSKELAENGFNIVSGLAIGCDTTGHRGALNANGSTTAFLATSLSWDAIYPKENLDLAKEIVEKGGLLLSEYHLGQQCGRFAFVARDRLQAGLSCATVVIQTGIKGGTMHAVNATLSSRKLLYAVRYRKQEDLDSDKVQGNIMLLEKGMAKPLNMSTLYNVIKEIKSSAGNRQEQSNCRQQSFAYNEYTETSNMKSIIFDLDLTLVDTTILEEARHTRNWKEAYRLIPQTTLYPGIKEVLDFIRSKGMKVAIVSTAPRPYIEKLVAFHHIPAQYIVGYHDAKPIKPHPASMQKALGMMGVPSSSVISFGDRAIDIYASNAADIESVACLWGSKEVEKLVHSPYKHAISSPMEIIPLLEA